MIGRLGRVILHASYATGGIYALTCIIRGCMDLGLI